MDLLYVFDVTAPANTPATAPVEVPTVVAGLYYVSRVTIVIPDGHAGLTGIALAFGHQPVIPVNTGAYISGNDEIIPYDLGANYPAGVGWSVFLVNTDIVTAHSWETRWELTLQSPGLSGGYSTLTANDILQAAQSAAGG